MSTLAIHPGISRPRGRTTTRPTARPTTRPTARPTSSAPVRLTRRGRLVVVVLMLGVLLAVGAAFGSHSAATGESGRPVQTRTIEVGQGDTLWGIASDVAKPGQVRETVHQIEELNALTGPGLREGQELAVPVG